MDAKTFYEQLAPELDPGGFKLYFTAQRMTGFDLYKQFPYEDSRARYLLDQATDVRFFVGRAKNPSHQSPQLHIDFSIKMSIVEKLETLLREMGKQVTVEYC